MLIDALVPIDCRAASFRHLPSRRRATIIPITRPPLLTLIDAPFSPGLSRYRMPKSDRCGIPTSAGWKRQHGDKGTLSNWRSPPRPGAKSSEQGRSYNRLNREVDRRREGGGWVRSSEEVG